MSADIIRFPGFILLDDRKTIAKDGKRYPSIKAGIADLPHEDCKRTFEWRVRRCMWLGGHDDAEAAAVLDYRARVLRDAVYGYDGGRQQGGAA